MEGKRDTQGENGRGRENRIIYQGKRWRSISPFYHQVPACQRCGGVLKPDIVFFGDNVPRAIVDCVHAKLTESDAMLVVGSSLEVTVFANSH